MSRHQPLFAICVSILFLSSNLLGALSDFENYSAPNLPGRLYVPPEAADSDRPIILFLHGAGESGTNNTAQVNPNINNLLSAAQERGAFLYAPQTTTVVGGIYNWNDRTRTAQVMSMIDRMISERNVDPTRIYLTGLSMGGGGSWNMASRFPDRFAATVPIAGVLADTDFDPTNLLDMPTWAFHARNDGVITKDRSRNVIDSILTAGGEAVLEYPENSDRETLFEYSSDTRLLNYTEFPTGGHGIWGGVYATQEMYDWLFTYTTNPPDVGDFSGNGFLDVTDIDVLATAFGTDDLSFDLNGDNSVSLDDTRYWVETLRNTFFGDSNLDGEFNTTDLIAVFQGAEFEDGIAGNSTWTTGDWNGDKEFDTADFVIAFQANGFEMGPRAPVAAVPEPATAGLLGMGCVLLLSLYRRN